MQPFTAGPGASLAPQETAAPAQPQPPADADEPPRVLAIDDNQSNLVLFHKILAGTNDSATPGLDALEAALFGSQPEPRPQRPRFAVDLCTDGQGGLACARRARAAGRPYALAFVDMRMPGGWDGLQTIAALWHEDPDLQVVICSAYADHSWDQITRCLGRSDRLLILRKPFDPLEILQLACALTEKWRLQQARRCQLNQLERHVAQRTQHLHAALEQRRRAEQELLQFFELTPDLLCVLDAEGHFVRLSPAVTQLLGYTPEALVNRPFTQIVHPEDRHSLLERLPGLTAAEPQASELTLRCLTRDGSPRWLEWRFAAAGHGGLYYGSGRDIGERKANEAQLQYQATHDALTGLANRTLLMDRLRQALVQARRHKRQLLLAFIDLDRFKLINDSLGHERGDQLLKAVAQRMAGCLRDSDTLARLGGDQFVLLLPELEQVNAGMPVIARLLACVAEPLELGGQSLGLSCSVGCSAYPADGDDADDLLRFADTAMYRAKELGRANIQVHNAELRAHLDQRLRLESALRHAVARDELSLHYQPQIDLGNGQIQGLEALLRWHHPELGDIAPARFIPIAEDAGLIAALGEWALQRACQQLREWQDQGLPPLRVAVNLSAKQLLRPGLADLVSRCLAETGVDPTRLELELTESASMDDPERIIPLLQRLRALGVSLSIDDFGSGYSNLSYLTRFPVQKLKIDGAFIKAITTDAGSMAIIDAAIAMAHRLGLKVVAEMAESEGQVVQLAAHGCDLVQGYYFSRPMSAAQLTPLLQTGHMALPASLGSTDGRRTVLVLDDEQNITTTLERALCRQGYQVLTANCASDAFDLLARHAVGVVLSDQRMPDMQGCDFLNQVRMLYPDAVRILFTGYTDFASAQRAINLGAVHRLIAKPWDDQELSQALALALEQYERARRERLSALTLSPRRSRPRTQPQRWICWSVNCGANGRRARAPRPGWSARAWSCSTPTSNCAARMRSWSRSTANWKAPMCSCCKRRCWPPSANWRLAWPTRSTTRSASCSATSAPRRSTSTHSCNYWTPMRPWSSPGRRRIGGSRRCAPSSAARTSATCARTRAN
ncbi:MAG: EAL domain-containing protein [Pseudomonas sp.]